ncbi:hypothetical protein HDU77_008930 [Chytriomyces hyalinus]|nr:hypothetical protein HDU77_008930 [Chytriomyces hyalinus]
MPPTDCVSAPFSLLSPTTWKISAPLLVIPPLFLHVLAATLGSSPLNQFLILKVCDMLVRDGIPGNGTEAADQGSYVGFGAGGGWSGGLSGVGVFPGRDYKTCAARPDVSATAASWNQLISLATAIPSFLLVPIMGRLVDKVGRRTLMVLPIMSTMIGTLSIIAVASLGISLWFFVAVHVLQGFMGGYVVLSLCAYAYIGDTTTTENRTRTFLIVDAFAYFAVTIGPFTGGVIYRNLGLLSVFGIVLMMEMVVLMYVIFILPESLQQKEAPVETEPPAINPTTLWSSFKNTWMGCLDVLSGPGRGRSVFILASVTAVGSMSFAGYTFVFFFYPAQKFGWDSYDAGLFSLASSVCRLLYLSLLLPFLLRKLTEGKTELSKTRIELTLIRLGIFAYSIGLVCFGLASSGEAFFYVVAFYAFGVIATPLTRGLLSRAVPSSAQGSLFAALEVLQTGSSLLAQFVLPSIFRASVSAGKPQIICFVLAGGWMGALFLTTWLKSRELAAVREEQQQEPSEATALLSGGAANTDAAPALSQSPSFLRKSFISGGGYGSMEQSWTNEDFERGPSNFTEEELEARLVMVMGMEDAVDGSVQENRL